MRFDQLLLDTKMVVSKSEANRLCKQGAVSFRWTNRTGWFRVKPGDELLEPYPAFYLKVGNGFWRCIRDQESGKFRQQPGIVTIPGVMVDGKYVQEIPYSRLI